MKKDYSSPEFDLMKIKFDSIMTADDIRHSDPEGFGEGGGEGPDE